jgi:hypothetical protein
MTTTTQRIEAGDTVAFTSEFGITESALVVSSTSPEFEAKYGDPQRLNLQFADGGNEWFPAWRCRKA